MSKVLGSDRGITVTAQNINEASTTQKHKLGERLVRDERVFRYVKCVTEALRPGKAACVTMTPEESAVAGAASAIGINTATITVTAAAGLAVDALAGGYLCYRSTDWHSHKIVSHPAADNGATCVLTLETDIVNYAIASGTTILTAYPSMWKVRQYAVGPVAGFFWVGIPKCTVAINSYGWLQTWGPCSICPGAYLGADGEIETVFTIGGALAADTIAYQRCGLLMPDNYTVETAQTDLIDSNHLVFLTLCP